MKSLMIVIILSVIIGVFFGWASINTELGAIAGFLLLGFAAFGFGIAIRAIFIIGINKIRISRQNK